jgi:hypothetical protein
MTHKHNPLSAYFRAPKLYTPIPSRGKFYTPDVVEMPENGELPVFPMTARDEMIMKNPDALLNGEAVSEVIKSCVPNVKNVKRMMSSDVDVLLVAIQGATYGDDVDIKATCPKCNQEQEVVASVEAAIQSMAVLEDSYQVEHQGLVVEIRPFTYESTIQAGIANFQSTRSLQSLADIEDEMDRLRLFNDNFKKIAALNFRLITDSVASITLPGTNGDYQIVTDRIHIQEFMENTEAGLGKKIEEKIKEVNKIGINHEMQVMCSTPECAVDGESYVFTSNVNFDPVNFFTAS